MSERGRERVAQGTDELISRLLAACNSHDLERLARHFSQDYVGVDVNDATPHEGPQDAGRAFERYLAAFPDLYITTEETLIDGDRVALLWTARGTHFGPFMQIPPTRRHIAVRGTAVLVIEGGLVRRGWYVWDVAGLLRALGLLPELARHQ